MNTRVDFLNTRLVVCLFLLFFGEAGDEGRAEEVLTKPITFMSDGGWCWYQDPRALISDGKLIVGGVSGQSGDVKVSVYDLDANVDLGTVTLRSDFQKDDHDVPAHFIMDEVNGRHRPYARYAKKSEDTIAVSLTEAHPRNFGNSIYYAEFRDGSFYRSSGQLIKRLKSEGPLIPAEAERVYRGSEIQTNGKKGQSAPNSAWTSSIAFDGNERQHIGYTLYLSNDDHRYRLASWNGEGWNDREVAYAGKCLYLDETSYTGLITLDPSDPTSVYISSDVDPTSGRDLGGSHEVYHAKVNADDSSETIEWEPVTSGFSVRNIRPMVVSGQGRKVVLWLRGPWNTYKDYQSDIVGMILE